MPGREQPDEQVFQTDRPADEESSESHSRRRSPYNLHLAYTLLRQADDDCGQLELRTEVRKTSAAECLMAAFTRDRSDYTQNCMCRPRLSS